MKFEINMLKENLYTVQLGVSQPSQLINIDTTLHLEGKYFLGVKKKPRGIFTVSVENLRVGNLKLKDMGEKPLITIMHDDKRGESISFDVSSYDTQIYIVLDPSVIEDYNLKFSDITQKECINPVLFDLKVSKDGKEYDVERDLSINIKVQEPDILADVNFLLDDNLRIHYDPTSQSPFCIGCLNIEHSSTLSSAPDISTDFSLQVTSLNEIYRNFIYLDINELKESNPTPLGGDVVIQGARNTKLVHNVLQINNDTCYRIENIESKPHKNIVSIPIMMDLSKIQNPTETIQNFDISVTGQCHYVSLENNKSANFHNECNVQIYKNTHLNKLEVVCVNNTNGIQKCINSGEVFNWDKQILNPGFVNRCTICIMNTAEVIDTENPNSCIIVKNLRQKPLIGELKRLKFADKNMNADKYFKLIHEGESIGAGEYESVYKLYPRGKNIRDRIGLSLTINANDIIEIERDERKFSIQLELGYEFEYAVVKDASVEVGNDEYKKYEGRIKWILEKAANPSWLSVDFGTSAIAASFANFYIDGNPNTLLDLKANKELLLRRTYGDKTGKREDNPCEPSPFISSTICFNSNNKGPYDKERQDSEFCDYPVWLSPSTGMMDIMLPCLKCMVGYKTLPNILTDDEVNNFDYYINDEKVRLYSQDGNENSGLMSINNILEEVYKQLFNHYICLPSDHKPDNPIVKDQLHKLVLSVPNTFTPKHYALLKSVAYKIFPNLHTEYLQVVSESDAVACFYVHKRDEFFRTSNIAPEIKKNLDECEKVLVFDMGAGTLDLTYFVKNMNTQNRITIDIRGKMGVNKAGNYLDYLLGEILSDFLSIAKHEDADVFQSWLELDKVQRITHNTGRKDCEALKNYIKNELKPMLNSSSSVLPIYKRGDYTFEFKKEDGTNFTIADIKATDKYKTYIEECTSQVISNFIYLFGDKNVGLLNDNTPKLDVDVLVFSGRSSSLLDIRQSVVNCVCQYASSGKNVIFADLSTGTFIDKNELSVRESGENVNINLLKTVVTYGSLLYADWIHRKGVFRFTGKKVFANLGVLIHNVYNKWEWYPLITNKSSEKKYLRPDVFNTSILFDESTSYPLQQATEVLFVQSYSRNTKDDWQKGNKDMISEMAYYPVPGDIGGQNYNIRMTLDENNDICCYIENVGMVNLEPHDDFQNESLRKSLWPVVF